ncbi:MAG: hypothetical protein ACYTFG_19880 [Planctomycetota bacterium]|jgi:hypothetical protein
MSKGRIAGGFIGVSLLLAGTGAALAWRGLGGEDGRSAALGVALGFGGTLVGFLVLLANVDRSMNRFMGAYAAGMLLRLALLGGALGLALAGLGKPEPLLVAMAFTVFALLILEGAFLWIGTRGSRECP